MEKVVRKGDGGGNRGAWPTGKRAEPPRKREGFPKKWAYPSEKRGQPKSGRGLWAWPKEGGGLRAADPPPPRPSPGGDYAKDTPTFDKQGPYFTLG